MTPPKATTPKVGLLTMLRLGLFQMCLGIMAVLTLGVLNRVLIAELKVSALLAAGAIAMHQFVAPMRIFFGRMSDVKPLFLGHRTGYVWLGSLGFVLCAFAALQVVWLLADHLQNGSTWDFTAYLYMTVIAAIFTLYGIAISSSSTPFTALLVDISDPENRSRLVGIVWSMLTVGIVVGAIISSVILRNLGDAPSLQNIQQGISELFFIVGICVLGLVVFATFGVERKYSRLRYRQSTLKSDNQMSLVAAWRILTQSSQTWVFFSYLVVLTLSLYLQEAILEPYGALVFGMNLSETTQLNAFWGVGLLIGMLLTGFVIVPKLGKVRATKIGCIVTSASFFAIIASGFLVSPLFLKLALLGFGISVGVVSNGTIALTLDLTSAQTAGTFVGAWGLAQAMSRAVATVVGGGLLDLGRYLSSLFGFMDTSDLFAFTMVFAIQAVGMIFALLVLRQINIKQFRGDQHGFSAVAQNDL